MVESGLEEVVDGKTTQAASDDSALALLADITSKYQQGEPTIHVIKKGEEVCCPYFIKFNILYNSPMKSILCKYRL